MNPSTRRSFLATLCGLAALPFMPRGLTVKKTRADAQWDAFIAFQERNRAYTDAMRAAMRANITAINASAAAQSPSGSELNAVILDLRERWPLKTISTCNVTKQAVD